MKNFSRRDFIHAGCVAGVATLSPHFLDVAKARSIHGSATINARKMQLGLQGIVYFSGFSPFLNWMYCANSPDVFQATGGILFAGDATMWTSANASGAPYFDSVTGDVKMPFNTNMASFSRKLFEVGFSSSAVLAAEIAGGYTTQTFVAYCHSDWTIQVGSVGTGGSIVSGQGTNQVTFVMGAGTDASPIVQVFPVGTPTNPPALKTCKAAFKSRLDGGETFDPDWLEIVRPFGILRYMDWNQTNGSLMADYAQLADATYPFWGAACTTATGTASGFGFVSGMPLQVICDLSNQTGTEIHYCIPAMATNAFVTSVATFFKNNTTNNVTYEYSNECWNTMFAQQAYCASQAPTVPGNPWSGDSSFAQGVKWYGYRATAVMAIIKGVYNDTTRWRGGLGTQSADPAKTDLIAIGAQYYLTNVIGSGVPRDYFRDLLVTGYIGDAAFSDPGAAQSPSAITQHNPGVVTCSNHGKNNGDRIKLFVATGMTQLNDVYATVANKTANTFELQGIDTSGYTPFVADFHNFFMAAIYWQVMDDSLTNHNSSPGTYPTKYTYFNQQLAAALLNGTSSSGLTVDLCVANQSDPTTGSWKLQKDRCASGQTLAGLQLRQYEGAMSWQGPPRLADGSGASPQFNDYFMNTIWSSEIAATMAASYPAFAAYGDRPSHFTEGGQMGIGNPWPGLRAVPQDVGNPGWQAVLNYNRGP